MIIKIVAFGFLPLFISVVTMNYGLKGMLLVFAYIIPWTDLSTCSIIKPL